MRRGVMKPTGTFTDPRRERMDELKRAADRISFLIVASDYPMIDITIERSKLRAMADDLFPGRDALFDMIYEARFDRLIEQFRSAEGSPWPAQ